MRKVLALLLALAMVAALGAAALAAGTCTITVNNTKIGETYKLYKLFDLSVDDPDAPTAFTYTVTTEWKDFFATGAGAVYVGVDAATGTITAKESFTDAAALAVAASAELNGKTVASTQTATGATVEFSGLDNGYYLITSSLGTLAMIETTPQSSAVTVNDKNPVDTIVKHVKEDSTSDYGAANDAEIGQLVEFKSVATIEPHTRNVKIHDTMSVGLDFTTGSIKIYVGTEVNDSNLLATEHYEIQATPDTDDTFTIVIKDTYIATLTSKTNLTLTYTATLNDKAVSAEQGSNASDPTGWSYTLNEQQNKTVITYGDKQSVESTTTTTTHKLEILKYANGDKTKRLAGAVFQLKNAAGEVVKLSAMQDSANYRVDPNGSIERFTTVANQNIVIWGLDSDDYTLVEVQAPDGYNKANDATVTVSAQDNTVAEVENKAGNTLPSTGGMGTTIFYVIGSILVIGAVVLLVSKKRMNAAD
ncbi:MAG: SpaA isopeptide-forming pilin-related protein [Candidatus Faecousia sp.]|nr:SpaA isopeptide-forming pilin-related protein [Candidatus Faecousia sp.]